MNPAVSAIRIGYVLSLLLSRSDSSAPDESPLLLTPYIESGRIHEAQNLSFVSDLEPHVPSHSGFITVDRECNSNMWFWFFPSENDPSNDPVSVWLNGGPGTSSAFSLFTGNGPYDLSPSGEVTLRKERWTRNSSLVYVDNPVGTGFSFADSPDECYCKNQTRIGESFLIFLEQFFQLFPEYRTNPFYLAGESYAGKYLTSIARAMLRSTTQLRLDGVAIGNGLIDPRTQFSAFSENYYQLGIVDRNGREKLAEAESEFVRLIDEKKFREASSLRWDVIDGKFGEEAGYTYFYNYLESDAEAVPVVDYNKFLDRPEVRKALHVGKVVRDNGTLVNSMLEEDKMQSVRPWFEYNLEKVRTMLYFGQMDLRVPYSGGVKFMEKMNWSKAKEYRSAERKVWRVNSRLAGYVKSGGLFTEVLIRNAGHMVPTNQPVWALDLYNKFIFNEPIGEN